MRKDHQNWTFRLGLALCLFAFVLQFGLPLAHHWNEKAQEPCVHALLDKGFTTPEDPAHHQHDPLACALCSSSHYSDKLAAYASSILILVPRSKFHRIHASILVACLDSGSAASPRAPPFFS